MKLSLTSTERNFLYYKYVNNGMDPIQAGKKLQKIRDYVDHLLWDLKEKGKTHEEINVVFKREFTKLCEETNYRDRKRNNKRRSTRRKA